jgi:hypothetical protein
VYETVQLHQFNLKNPIADALVGVTRGWLVPHYWTNKYPREGVDPTQWEPGGDCISGAVFTNLAVHMTGVPGAVAAKNYMSKSPPGDPYTAAEYPILEDPARRRKVGGEDQVLMHFDRGGGANQFEGTVVYSDGIKTYYFPAGVAVAYDKADYVLSVFVNFGWARWDGTKWVLVELLARWDDKPSPPRINLYE